MSAVTVRIPEDLHRQLRRIAEDEHRSLNNLMIVLFAEGVKARRPKKVEPQR